MIIFEILSHILLKFISPIDFSFFNVATKNFKLHMCFFLYISVEEL